jgi:hypothetical protein
MNPTAAATLDLRDIHAAPPPAFWPPAPGWWVLAAVLLAVLVIVAVWGYRRYRASRQKRRIMDELAQLGSSYTQDNNAGFVTELSTLLRRVALRRYARTRVASLTGAAWLRFLDDTGGAGEFEKGVGRILEAGPYQPQTREVPAAELLALVRLWVSKNLEAAV